jgi:hypothetical protein
MEQKMNELFEEKLKVVLNLIRTNSSAEDAMKISQAACNLVHARSTFAVNQEQEPKTQKKQGSGT